MKKRKIWQNFFRVRRRAGMTLLAALLAMGATVFSGCGLLEQASDVFYDGLGTLVVGSDEEAEAVSTGRYGYQCLDEEGRTVYDQLVAAISNLEEKVVISTKEKSVLEQAFAAVLADYGEFFWINGYRYNAYTSGERIIGLEVMPTYTMGKEEVEEAKRQVEETAAGWLAELPESAGDYEKSKYVYELLIRQVDYVEGVENNQNILSVFLDRQTVCQGYAEAAAYLLQKLGVQAAVIHGTAREEPHAWNLVRLDGEYYYMDVTWGGSNYVTADDREREMINYAYLNMTTEDLELTHSIDGQIPVPSCIATADNYYRREGRFFDQWEPEEIGAVWKGAWDSGAEQATVRFSDEGLYQQAVDYFITGGKLSSYCRGMRTIHYLENRELLVLTLQF